MASLLLPQRYLSQAQRFYAKLKQNRTVHLCGWCWWHHENAKTRKSWGLCGHDNKTDTHYSPLFRDKLGRSTPQRLNHSGF